MIYSLGMRILQVGKYYPPCRGGMETVLRHMCEGLAERGHEVTALVAAASPRGSVAAIGGARAGGRGRLVRAGTIWTLNGQPLCPRFSALLRRELRASPPDIVQLHLPNPAACAAVLANLRGDRARPRLTVWYHADITRQRLGRRAVAPLVARCLDRAAGVAVSSEALRTRSPLLRSRLARVRVIPFGIEPAEWSGGRHAHDGPFLFVGRLVRYKGLGTLLDAVARAPRARLQIVGGGPLRRELAGRVSDPALSERVSLLGELDDVALRAAMGQARALVLPSDGEGETFGVVQLEAMAAGLPVISTRLPTGVAAVNADGVTGRVVPPADAGALAGALVEILDNPERSRAWGEAGRRRVRESFSRDRMLDDIERWYADLLAQPD